MVERGRILYVEDEDQNWLAAQLRLRKSYDLIRAKSDREACAAVIEHGNKLTAILMDIQLTGSALDGITLTRLFRGKLDTSGLPPYAQAVPALDVPILIVTAYGALYSETELIAAGGDRFISKPVDFVQLTSALTQLRLERVMDRSRRASL
jgi:CheY-like chemotaxis protein